MGRFICLKQYRIHNLLQIIIADNVSGASAFNKCDAAAKSFKCSTVIDGRVVSPAASEIASAATATVEITAADTASTSAEAAATAKASASSAEASTASKATTATASAGLCECDCRYSKDKQ